MHTPLTYIIILNWNGWQDTIKCLDSVLKLNYSNYKTIVIDNGSTNDSIKQIENWGTKAFTFTDTIPNQKIQLSITNELSLDCLLMTLNEKFFLISHQENLGFSGGCNLGIAYALQEGADYIFLLNNDATINFDAINQLITVAQQAKAFIAGAIVLNTTGDQALFAGSHWPNHLFFKSILTSYNRKQKFWDTPYAEGSALLAHKDVLKQRVSEYGYFLDPKLFLYYEDTDLCIYARERNYRCIIVRDALIYHSQAKSSGGVRSCYYTTRNRIHIANKTLKQPLKIIFHIYYIPSRLAILIFKILSGQLKKNLVKAIINGLSDGYLGITGKWINHENI